MPPNLLTGPMLPFILEESSIIVPSYERIWPQIQDHTLAITCFARTLKLRLCLTVGSHRQ